MGRNDLNKLGEHFPTACSLFVLFLCVKKRECSGSHNGATRIKKPGFIFSVGGQGRYPLRVRNFSFTKFHHCDLMLEQCGM